MSVECHLRGGVHGVEVRRVVIGRGGWKYVSIEGFTGSYVSILSVPNDGERRQKDLYRSSALCPRRVRRAQYRHHTDITRQSYFLFQVQVSIVLVVVLVHWLMI